MAQNCYDSPHFAESCGCPPAKAHHDEVSLKSLDDVVKDYRKKHYDNLETFLRDLKGDICKCVYGPFDKYKKHPHQRRIPNKVLKKVIYQLEKNRVELAGAKTFPELYSIVDGIEVPGYGLLATYDFAIRYAFGKGIVPEDVYLHAGTLEGAKTVLAEKKKIHPGDIITVKELQKPLQKLNGLHLENLLCIYKKELKRITNS